MFTLLRMRWTGLGCLSVVLLVVTLVLAGGAAAAVGPGGQTEGGLAIVAVLVGGGAVNWLLGRLLNSERTPDGSRLRTDQHTLMDTPMEHTSVGFLVLALIILASVVGRTVSPVLGWLTFVLVPVVALVLLADQRERAIRRRTTDRQALAEGHGWNYEPKSSELAGRWQDILGWRSLSVSPFGIVSGEAHGLPFTMFDSMSGLDRAQAGGPRTLWVVQLPVAHPRIHVRRRQSVDLAWGNAPTVAVSLDVDCDTPGLADALLTPEVRSATESGDYDSWQILGHDLVVSGQMREHPTTPPELETSLAQVLHLARLLSAAPGHGGRAQCQ
jgi:membrane protein YqaA with SNARE-associated domain